MWSDESRMEVFYGPALIARDTEQKLRRSEIEQILAWIYLSAFPTV